MKTIEQLLELSSNPYYSMTNDEQQRLDDFLFKKSEQKAPAKRNGKKSEKNIPATVINKNIVKKETGQIPTVDNVVEAKTTETAAVEEAIHPDAVNDTPMEYKQKDYGATLD